MSTERKQHPVVEEQQKRADIPAMWNFGDDIPAFKDPKALREHAGGKGLSLYDMTHTGQEQGYEVPAGFTISTQVCQRVLDAGGIPEDIQTGMREQLARVEASFTGGKAFGNPENPLLVSCRSGGAQSMPGMMDTVLNIGLNDQIVNHIIAQAQASGDEERQKWVYKSYARLMEQFALITKGDVVDEEHYESRQTALLGQEGVPLTSKGKIDIDAASVEQLASYVAVNKALYLECVGEAFPQEPQAQLLQAAEAVFKSSNNERAQAYKKHHGLPADAGTACNIQSMVFGNKNYSSATGVLFTRSNATGDNVITGEILFNAQGEDVVAGTRTPIPLELLALPLATIRERAQAASESKEASATDKEPYAIYLDVLTRAAGEKGTNVEAVKADHEAMHAKLIAQAKSLEKDNKFPRDIEFTVEDSHLFMLQNRDLKTLPQAFVKIAADLQKEGIATFDEVLVKAPANLASKLSSPYFTQEDREQAVKEDRRLSQGGITSGGGAASGIVCFTNAQVTAIRDEEKAQDIKKRDIIFVRPFTKAENFASMAESVAILTAEGGRTSHAAVVATQLGIACIVGNTDVSVAEDNRSCTIGGRTIRLGEQLSVISEEGQKAQVFQGAMQVHKRDPYANAHLQQFLAQAAEIVNTLEFTTPNGVTHRPLGFAVNAESADAIRAATASTVTITDPDTQQQVTLPKHDRATKVGLARTEHMFEDTSTGGERFATVVQFLSLLGEKDKVKATQEMTNLLPAIKRLQQQDFADIFRALAENTETKEAPTCAFRLLDPPPHEFAPTDKAVRSMLEDKHGINLAQLDARFEKLKESNPLAGVRGIRLHEMTKEHVVGNSLYKAQIEAIFDAASQVTEETGKTVIPKIMVPIASTVGEVEDFLGLVEEARVARGLDKADFKVGAMIETPRACLEIDGIAGALTRYMAGHEKNTFISFGTNDLTNGTFLASRDDCTALFTNYKLQDFVGTDPYEVIDPKGVERLLNVTINGATINDAFGRKAVIRGARAINPEMEIGGCGEQFVTPGSQEALLNCGVHYGSGAAPRLADAYIESAKVAVQARDKALAQAAEREDDIAMEPVDEPVRSQEVATGPLGGLSPTKVGLLATGLALVAGAVGFFAGRRS